MNTVLFVRDLYSCFDSEESSRFVSLSLIWDVFGMMSKRKTTTPRPPMKCVEDRQKSRLLGRDSTLERIVAPVVVKPETLSNQAFMMENGPPQRAYGSIPNMNESSHDRTIIT